MFWDADKAKKALQRLCEEDPSEETKEQARSSIVCAIAKTHLTPSRFLSHPHCESIQVPKESSPPVRIATVYVSSRPGPELSLPSPSNRRPTIDKSVVLQLGGLVWKCLGIRLERDVMASSENESHCKFYGHPPKFIPLSAFDGFYLAPLDDLPRVISTVASHHGRGVFIVRPGPSRMWTKNWSRLWKEKTERSKRRPILV